MTDTYTSTPNPKARGRLQSKSGSELNTTLEPTRPTEGASERLNETTMSMIAGSEEPDWFNVIKYERHSKHSDESAVKHIKYIKTVSEQEKKYLDDVIGPTKIIERDEIDDEEIKKQIPEGVQIRYQDGEDFDFKTVRFLEHEPKTRQFCVFSFINPVSKRPASFMKCNLGGCGFSSRRWRVFAEHLKKNHKSGSNALRRKPVYAPKAEPTEM